jgi:hypothetical protein
MYDNISLNFLKMRTIQRNVVEKSKQFHVHYHFPKIMKYFR